MSGENGDNGNGDAPEEYTEDDLDAVWVDELTEDERQEVLEQIEAESWDELDVPGKQQALVDAGHIEPPTGSSDDEEDEEQTTEDIEDEFNVDLDVDELAIEPELEIVGQNSPQVIIDGISVPGAREITLAGEGYESQYLRQIESGGGGGGDDGPSYEDSFDNGDSGSSEGEGDGTSGGDEGEEPPLHIEIVAAMGHDQAMRFVELRDQDDLFDVQVLGDTYEDMELHDFTRELTGQRPFAYETRIEVVEWREVEIQDPFAGVGEGGGGDSADGSNTDPAEAAEEVESGTPDDPQTYEMSEGEQRDVRVDGPDSARNIVFDTSADDAGGTLFARGDDWTISDVAWDAEENRSRIDSEGNGTIRNIFMGHQGDSGIVCQDGTQIDVGRAHIANSRNGVHVVEGDVGDHAVQRPSGLTGGGQGPTGNADIYLDYDAADDPSEYYNINDVRGSWTPQFTTERASVGEKSLHMRFTNDQKIANCEYRFDEHGHGMPDEIYVRFEIYPTGFDLGQDDTIRIQWLPLTNGPQSSGVDGAPDGTNGWSNAIGFANRNNSPAPGGYKFFSYAYHMDQPNRAGDLQMTDEVVQMDQWNVIEGHVVTNSYSGGSASPDGAMRYWVNGALAYENTDMRFTRSDSNLIEGTGPMGYRIGNSPGDLYYDSHEITLGPPRR